MASRTMRHAATKRTILGTLYENDCDLTSSTTETGKGIVKSTYFDECPELHSELDGTDTETVMLLLDDFEKKMKRQKDKIINQAERAMEAQQLIVFNKAMKLDKNIKKMTIREFNKAHGVDYISNVLNLLKNIDNETNKKRVVNKYPILQTPASFANKKLKVTTPSTVMRTVKKGEIVFSTNGSPVCNGIETEQGDLLATVSKKRQGGNEANFDARINVGEGRFITLSDTSTFQHLNDAMKADAIRQVEELQEQMNKLIVKLRS